LLPITEILIALVIFWSAVFFIFGGPVGSGTKSSSGIARS